MEVVSEDPSNTLYPGLSASSKRLMGLKEFKKLNETEEKNLLQSSDRFNAYSQVSTTTSPRTHKIEYKKGIIREVLKQKLIPDNILTQDATVYLGSGTDIEYPLALGARNIWLLDPIFQNEEAKDMVLKQVEKILTENAHLDGDHLVFNFDFGNGKEITQIHFESKLYGIEDVDLPKNIGLVIKFASQGPHGQIRIGNDIEENMTKDCLVLEESRLIQNGKVTEIT